MLKLLKCRTKVINEIKQDYGAALKAGFKNASGDIAEGLPFSYWISRIWWITQLNITWVLVITGILGILT